MPKAIRWVALEHAVNVFDRQAIMRHWSELGTFDLLTATKSLDTAAKVHDCLGSMLGDLIVEALSTAKPTLPRNPPNNESGVAKVCAAGTELSVCAGLGDVRRPLRPFMRRMAALCGAGRRSTRSSIRRTQIRERIAKGLPLKIVAIGSSSTFGSWREECRRRPIRAASRRSSKAKLPGFP